MNLKDSNELITWFQLNYPHHVKAMKESNHHYNETELNPFHGEGDIWTHTCMVLNTAKLMKYSDVILMSALLHDLGKPYVSEINDEKQKVYFKNHEGVSFWYAIEVVKKLTKDPKKIETVLKLISLHSVIFDNYKDGKFSSDFQKKFKKDQHFLELIKQQVISDSMGRFCLDLADVRDTFEEIFDENFYNSFNELVNTDVAPKKTNKITVLVGLPRSGKSTWIAKNKTSEVLICRDDEVMKLAKSKYGKETYSECFRALTDEDQKEVDKILDTKYLNAIRENSDIIVDMTNMSKKSRKRWLSPFQGHKTILVFATEYNECLRRNSVCKETEGKFIPEYVFFNMAKSFTYPQYDEADVIKIVL
jgi:predicted kinase